MTFCPLFWIVAKWMRGTSPWIRIRFSCRVSWSSARVCYAAVRVAPPCIALSRPSRNTILARAKTSLSFCPTQYEITCNPNSTTWITIYQYRYSQTIIIFLSFSIKRTKYLSDEWMITRGFLDVPVNEDKDLWWLHRPISDIGHATRPIDEHLVDEKTTITEALKTLKTKSIDTLLYIKDGYKRLCFEETQL